MVSRLRNVFKFFVIKNTKKKFKKIDFLKNSVNIRLGKKNKKEFIC